MYLKYIYFFIATDWFPVVGKLIRATHEVDTWSTPLYDRDPMLIRKYVQKIKGKSSRGRVTVLGDACHPMSMFKGIYCIYLHLYMK
jgi:2-polyprenyl-6-methoxyphenol hydroxylase-like FAD-dependent oxidoreductase